MEITIQDKIDILNFKIGECQRVINLLDEALSQDPERLQEKPGAPSRDSVLKDFILMRDAFQQELNKLQ
jgi:hypothetical protein